MIVILFKEPILTVSTIKNLWVQQYQEFLNKTKIYKWQYLNREKQTDQMKKPIKNKLKII